VQSCPTGIIPRATPRGFIHALGRVKISSGHSWQRSHHKGQLAYNILDIIFSAIGTAQYFCLPLIYMPVFNVCFSFGTFEVFYTEVSDNQVKSQKRQFSILNISDSHMACASAVVQYSIISVIMLRVIMCE
jgi:hypothetical protein